MKRILAAILSITLTFLLIIPFSAENEIPFTVTGATGGLNDTVTVTVNIGEGSMTTNGMFNVTYDPSGLEYVTYKSGTLLSSAILDCNSNTAGTLKFGYILINPVSAGGSMVEITFKIKSNTNQEYAIKLNVTEFMTADDSTGVYSDVPFTVTNGAITVKKTAADADGDGVVSEADLAVVTDYILGRSTVAENFDINDDGKCDITDLVQLRNIINLMQ